MPNKYISADSQNLWPYKSKGFSMAAGYVGSFVDEILINTRFSKIETYISNE